MPTATVRATSASPSAGWPTSAATKSASPPAARTRAAVSSPPGAFTSDTTTSIRDSKVVREAHDDAATFVASQGDIRGAQLESAFNTLRDRVPEARNASDQVLAEAILAL